MALVAGTIIDEARDLHPAFDPQTHPDKICLRFLSRWQKGFLQQILQRLPTLLDDGEVDITMPLATFEDGIALTELLALGDGEVHIGESIYPLTLIAYANRFDPQPLYAGWVINSRLYLSGKASDWTGVSLIRLRYQTTPADLTALASTLALPDLALSAAIHAVASFMAGRKISRTEGVDADPKYFYELAVDAEAKYLESLWLIDSATTHTIRDVM